MSHYIIEWETDGFQGYGISWGDTPLEAETHFTTWWHNNWGREYGRLISLMITERFTGNAVVSIRDKEEA